MPAVLLSLLFMPDMSEKKSPPQKEKSGLLRTPQAESKAFKRKLLSPEHTEDEDKKVTPKRKRPLGFDALSPDQGNSSSPRGGSGNVSRLSVPLSERQQMALLMRMTDESSQGDSSPKPSSPPQSVTSTKRSQADKKVNKRNERGETSLHLAAKRGDVKQTKKLIKLGASVNVTDYAGWTPLHEACNLGNVDVAKQLLKAGANVNVLGLGDESPLHDAAINNHIKLVTILLKRGANPLQPNVKGETPLDVANDLNIKKLLGREIISSNSETSSVDEVRSPTSPESLASIKDEDRGIDVEDIKPRSSSMSMVRGDNSCNPGSIAGNRRMSLPPKSPVDKSLPSPRLFLKFKSAGSSSGEEAGTNPGLSSRKSTDSKEPMFKSYILTMDTGDQQQQPPQQQQQQLLHPHSHQGQHRGERGSGRGSSRPSPACSPLPSMEVDHHQDAARDSHNTTSDHHHNQLHKHKVDPWDAVVGSGGGSGGGGGMDGVSSGGGGQNNVSSMPSATQSSSSSLSSSTFSTVPSLKVQCVPPDSSEEESGRGSSQASSLQRLRTEPFTPHVIEEVSDDDGDEKGGNVFEDSLRNQRLYHTNMGGPPRLSPNMAGPGSHLRRNSQHIPAIDSVNHGTASTTTKHRTSHPPPSVVSQVSSSASAMDVTSVCVSRSSGVTSTTGSGAVSLTSAEKDTSLTSSGASDRTSQLPPTFGNRRGSGGISVGGSGIGGGNSSGSISCVNSTGVVSSGVAVTGSSVSVCLTNVISSPSSSLASASQPQRWDPRPRTDRGDRASPKVFPSIDLFSAEKSDSSASSPLRMDIDENLSSSPRSDRDNDSRPSCLKVPPLKIILPSQKMSTTTHTPDQSKNPQAKPALPYVLNPTQTAAGGLGEWMPEMTDSNQLITPGTTAILQGEDLLHVGTSSPSRPSRPSSRASNRDENRNSTNRSSLESSPLVKEGAAGSGKEEEEGDEERQDDDEKGGGESRPTRTLRSHTAMKQQQEQKTPRMGGPGKAESVKDSMDKVSKADSKDFSENRDEGDDMSEAGGTTQQDEVAVHPRKRKLRPKTEAQSREQADNKEVVLEKPPNPYELYLNLRRQQMRNRHKMMCSVTPKLPTGFKDYLMVNCTYVLQGNTTSTLSVPMLTPPNSVTGPMRDLFLEQEKARYRLRLQHHIEREKLMLAIEQEILREHARAARAVANQNQPLSVCTILCEEEIYNLQELDQGEDRDKSSRSRYNGRQFYSWLQDVGDKYDNIKTLLLLRHHHEAESLHAVQKMDWEWKLKECGQCDSKTTPVIDEVHLPMVQVNDEFELLPPQRLRPS
ncbi:uncharacterized protein [Littorina saxatilis]|uniref:Ankyrin repeat domain-containing protein 12 n=1 Tax=Littorina saxatilis TaxID=31220 RepID=A0AAN9GNR0_9CAEN